ncbi:MAG: SEC-C domain-containing protein [Bacilli bacterium]|nr:SEC-C domain-containing protein [Bacilli bacterium]
MNFRYLLLGFPSALGRFQRQKRAKKCRNCRKIADSTPCGSGKKYKQCCGK